MKALWEGDLTFGLVTIPVRLYGAVEPKDIGFRLLHESCKTPLRYERYCPKHKHEVSWEEVVKGFEYEKGKFVIIGDEDFAKIPLRTTKAIEVEEVAELKDIDPLFFEKSYYIVPREKGEEAYALLRDALEQTKRILIIKFVQRNKEHLGLVRVHEGALVLNTLYYWDEVRPTEDLRELEKKVKPSQSQMDAALELLKSAQTKFSIAKYRDEYRDYMQKIITAKLEGKEPVLPPVAEAKKAKSLMDALRASIDLAKRKKRAKA